MLSPFLSRRSLKVGVRGTVAGGGRTSLRRCQRGVVLFLSLIVLVALMLGGLALFRSVDSSILVSGNVALQKNATRSGDAATENAIGWLTTNAGAMLYNDIPASGYIAAGLTNAKASNQTWAQYWESLAANVSPVTLGEDAAGNTPSYIVQRLCDIQGKEYSTGVNCVEPPPVLGVGSSKGPSQAPLKRSTKVYYRITVRTAGPKNAVSFIQTTVLM
jgi:Tfp pilus assembly protein PilX